MCAASAGGDDWNDWPAPAKINLFLHVTGRRADGYHLLQTVFQFLDYGDRISFSPREDGRVRRVSGMEGLAENADLAVRAATLLRREAGVRAGVDIHLDKRLPAGGGLGGGSSDAATVLCALNRLWGLDLPGSALARLGLQLGADVPVFVFGRAAWAEGVGEQLEAVDLPEPWYLVVCPPVQVSTAEVFAAAELTRDCEAVKIGGFLSGRCVNICEPVVFARYPEVREVHEWLASRLGNARMSGTGGCVFAAATGRAEAEAVLDDLPPLWRGFVARGCNSSPLRSRLGQVGPG